MTAAVGALAIGYPNRKGPTMTKLKLLTASGILAATVALAGCGSSSSGHDMGSMATPSSSGTPNSSSSAASSGETHTDADVTFASMMIPHHQQAIEMADLILAKEGVDAKVTDLATRIKGAQTPEITQLSGWLADWGQDPSPSSMGGGMVGMDHGDGMMSKADMDALKNATGNQATELFLTGMIMHHQGAVNMAQTELDQGQHPDAKALAQNIVKTQQSEIKEMTQLLRR